MDDGPLKDRKVREDECVDIDDYREMDKECAAAPISEEYRNFVGKELRRKPAFPVEKLHPDDRHKRAHGRIGQIDYHALLAPDKYEHSGYDQHYELDDR